MTLSGPDFLAIQVRDLEKAAAFYENVVGLKRATSSPPHAVVFQTEPTFALRDPLPGVDLESGQVGLGVVLWFRHPDVLALHAAMDAAGVNILQAPSQGPRGTGFVFEDLDGYAITINDRIPSKEN